VSTKRLGLALMILGGVLALVGLIGLLAGGGDDAPVAAPDEPAPTTEPETTTTQATTTTAEETTTTTEAETTTTTEAETTTTTQATTTTVAGGLLVEAFVPEFAGWIAAGDVDMLMASLHPVVFEMFDEDLCRAFVEREILALVDYRLAGDVSGPNAATFESTRVENVYTAPVAFTFQGQDFDSEGQFAVEDGQVLWFATCR
jgi:hypothetical protein